MKVKLDENLHIGLVEVFTPGDHDVETVADEGLLGAEPSVLLPVLESHLARWAGPGHDGLIFSRRAWWAFAALCLAAGVDENPALP